MIAASDLRKSYKDHLALGGVSFSVAPGEIFAYLGPNGAGKTTTIRIMTGLTRPDSGVALVAGRDLARDPKAKAGVGMVAQTINLDMELTVAENCDIHGRLFGLSRTRRREKTAEWLARVGLTDRAHSPVRTLSGGLRRRVMIARALLHEPAALFLDEPTVGLDADIRRQIWALIKDLQSSGVAIFLTTHYIEEAEALADKVAFLKAGRITATDTPKNLIDAIGAWAAVDLSGKNPAAFFQERSGAMAQAACQAGGVTVRRTSLEDAYLQAMGAGSVEASACVGGKDNGAGQKREGEAT